MPSTHDITTLVQLYIILLNLPLLLLLLLLRLFFSEFSAVRVHYSCLRVAVKKLASGHGVADQLGCIGVAVQVISE